MKTYIIADTHFNHNKLCELTGRPANFNDLIIENWNRVVGEDDFVLHLGDVILGHQSELQNILAKLKGRKFLVRGNHDKETIKWYLQRGFTGVSDGMIIHNILFTHEPSIELPRGVEWNIHGHFHNNPKKDLDYPFGPRNLLFVLEHHYGPIELNQFLKMRWNYEKLIYEEIA